jgi:ABC-2 type transport system permease protein
MAVYKRSYKGYAGTYTPEWSRFRVLTRYASRGLFKSKFMTGFFVLCFFPFLVTASMIYLNHNATILAMFKMGNRTMVDIDSSFFSRYLQTQVGFAFILTAFVGPGLISPDLANNGLVLYFCRPFSRAEYVAGKLLVLATLLSYITWIPGLVLFVIEGSLSGWNWMVANFYIAVAIVLSSLIMILVLSLLALALSAWVKWKPVAGALVLGVLFFGTGFAAAVNGIMRTSEGSLFSIPTLLTIVMRSLFRLDKFFDLPPAQAWVALLVIAAGCLFLLGRKIKAYEVVR